MKTMTSCVLFLLVLLFGETMNPPLAADEQRQAYDQMVEEAVREADEYVEQKKREQREAAKQKEKQQAHTAADERVKAERERLEDEMKKIHERGLDPNYTEGMRDNQLQELEDRLNRLESDPEAYFDH